MIGFILKTVFINESTLFFKLQTKAVHDWNLTSLSNVCHRIFLSIALNASYCLGPVHG